MLCVVCVKTEVVCSSITHVMFAFQCLQIGAMQGHMSSGLDQLLGALGEEFEAFEAEERINGDAGEESGTDRQGPSGRGQGKSKAALGRGCSAKRGRDIKAAPAGRAATPAGGSRGMLQT